MKIPPLLVVMFAALVGILVFIAASKAAPGLTLLGVIALIVGMSIYYANADKKKRPSLPPGRPL